MAISTLTTMLRRSGGTTAVIKSLRRHSTKTRVAQLAIFAMGIVFFFDPLVSIMVVGKVFGSIVQDFPLSSEKFSFLIDTTATPVTSIFPKSTWLIFAADLIQREIDKIKEAGNEEINFGSGYSLALSSISYQFYPCLLLGLSILQILTGREIGPILDAEKRARFSHNRNQLIADGGANVKTRSCNWYLPFAVLNIFIWYSFSQQVESGKSEDLSSLATTWLTSAVATIIITQMLFVIQKRDGKFPIVEYFIELKERNRMAYLTDTFPSVSSSASIPYNLSSKSEDADGYLKSTPKKDRCKVLDMNTGENESSAKKNYLGCWKGAPLLNPHDGIACLVHGIATAIPITLSLIFSWATGSIYVALGVDRMIISWILHDSLSTEIMPVAVFLASFLLSLIIGSSWCSISILIPGTMPLLVDSLGGDSKVVALTLASILSGAAAGDHIGPFSETAILSAIIAGSEIRRHILTQAPYALFVFILSVLVGTLPISYGGYPDYVGHTVGVAVLIVFVVFACRQVDGSQTDQSSIPGQIQDQPITQTLYPLIGGRGKKRSENSAGRDNQHQESTMDNFSILDSSTQVGTEVVEASNGMSSIQIQSKTHNLRSFKNKLKKVNSERCDPILGLVEDGLLPEKYRSESQMPPLGDRLPSIENKKRLIEATIKNAEKDGNMFSDSLRTFLRTAEQKLGKILDNNENLEVSGSASADSTGDDSLDNLMMDIAAKGWRKGINNLLGDEEDGESLTSAGEEYTTDEASTLMESDDSATATSSSLGGNGQSTYFTGNGDITSCASSATDPSEFSSRLIEPLEFSKSRETLQHGRWNNNEEFQIDDAFSVDYTIGSF
jgi:Na+/H+ antiporter NhaC